jgi:hypothetical protein
LRASVAELRERSVEQAVLFPERFDIGVCVRLSGLESHVCIGDLWDRCKVEDYSEREHEARNRQVNPLDILERLLIVADVVENSVGSDDRCHDRSDSVIGSSQQDSFKLQHQPQSRRTHPLKACEKLILISEYFGGPQTVIYGFAAVSKLPSPFPIMKIAAQKPPKLLFKMQGQATRDPTPYKHRPQMKVAL